MEERSLEMPDRNLSCLQKLCNLSAVCFFQLKMYNHQTFAKNIDCGEIIYDWGKVQVVPQKKYKNYLLITYQSLDYFIHFFLGHPVKRAHTS